MLVLPVQQEMMMTDVRKFHFEQVNRKPPPAVGEKWEIDKAEYWYALESFCPPLGWTGPEGHSESFYSREFRDDVITKKFTREGDRYFCEFAEYPGGQQAMVDEMQERSYQLLGKPGTPEYVFNQR
jgi:hypothetical protein